MQLFRSVFSTLFGCFAIYAVLALGYLPSLADGADALPVLLESLEIGAYKPLLVILPAAMVSWKFPYFFSFSAVEKQRAFVKKMVRLFFVCGGIAGGAFGVYIGFFSVFTPFACKDTLLQIANSPHASVYLNGQWFSFFLFHGLLLFFAAGACSFLFLAFYQIKQHTGFAFAYSLLLYQTWSFIGTIFRLPGSFRVGNLISGWFWVSEDSPFLDIGWALCMWAIVSLFSIVGFIVIRLKRKEGGHVEETA